MLRAWILVMAAIVCLSLAALAIRKRRQHVAPQDVPGPVESTSSTTSSTIRNRRMAPHVSRSSDLQLQYSEYDAGPSASATADQEDLCRNSFTAENNCDPSTPAPELSRRSSVQIVETIVHRQRSIISIPDDHTFQPPVHVDRSFEHHYSVLDTCNEDCVPQHVASSQFSLPDCGQTSDHEFRLHRKHTDHEFHFNHIHPFVETVPNAKSIELLHVSPQPLLEHEAGAKSEELSHHPVNPPPHTQSFPEEAHDPTVAETIQHLQHASSSASHRSVIHTAHEVSHAIPHAEVTHEAKLENHSVINALAKSPSKAFEVHKPEHVTLAPAADHQPATISPSPRAVHPVHPPAHTHDHEAHTGVHDKHGDMHHHDWHHERHSWDGLHAHPHHQQIPLHKDLSTAELVALDERRGAESMMFHKHELAASNTNIHHEPTVDAQHPNTAASLLSHLHLPHLSILGAHVVKSVETKHEPERFVQPLPKHEEADKLAKMREVTSEKSVTVEPCQPASPHTHRHVKPCVDRPKRVCRETPDRKACSPAAENMGDTSDVRRLQHRLDSVLNMTLRKVLKSSGNTKVTCSLANVNVTVDATRTNVLGKASSTVTINGPSFYEQVLTQTVKSSLEKIMTPHSQYARHHMLQIAVTVHENQETFIASERVKSGRTRCPAKLSPDETADDLTCRSPASFSVADQSHKSHGSSRPFLRTPFKLRGQ